MKHTILRFSALFIILLVSSCSNDDYSISGSGNITTEERLISTFSNINSPSSINIHVIFGTEQTIEVSADDNIINRVETTVTNSTLTVDLVNGNYSNITVLVTITVPNISEIKNSGSGTINTSGFVNLNTLTIINSGSGSMQLNGSGSILNVTNSGSGSFNGFDNIVENCLVTNSGSGNSEIYCINMLSGINSGSGNILYKGNPEINITNSGSGDIINAN